MSSVVCLVMSWVHLPQCVPVICTVRLTVHVQCILGPEADTPYFITDGVRKGEEANLLHY